MAVLKICDEADQYRIEIAGNFTGSAVEEVDRNWQTALTGTLQRKITVDISHLSDYDKSGCKLLRKMHQHGTVIAAATPRSLIFLQEITAPPRRGPLLLQQTAGTKQQQKSGGSSKPKKTLAAGQ